MLPVAHEFAVLLSVEREWSLFSTNTLDLYFAGAGRPAATVI
jgi:hypothetical protein